MLPDRSSCPIVPRQGRCSGSSRYATALRVNRPKDNTAVGRAPPQTSGGQSHTTRSEVQGSYYDRNQVRLWQELAGALGLVNAATLPFRPACRSLSGALPFSATALRVKQPKVKK
jgi:hypothetical protein